MKEISAPSKFEHLRWRKVAALASREALLTFKF
jgi:hypothetical protein